MLRFLPLAALFLLTACGSDGDSATDAVPGDLSSVSAETVAPDIDPCEALTPAMIAAASGAPEADVILDEEGMAESAEYAERFNIAVPGTACQYDFARGSDYDNARLNVVAYESVSAAEAAFAGKYRAMSEAELDQAQAAVDQAVASGEVDPEALGDTDAGEMIRGMAASSAFEPVPGVGDQAVVEINGLLDPAIATGVFVRKGASIYEVTLNPGYALLQQPDAVRTAMEDLARRVAQD